MAEQRESSVGVHMRLSPDTIAELDKLAQSWRLSRGGVVSMLVALAAEGFGDKFVGSALSVVRYVRKMQHKSSGELEPREAAPSGD